MDGRLIVGTGLVAGALAALLWPRRAAASVSRERRFPGMAIPESTMASVPEELTMEPLRIVSMPELPEAKVPISAVAPAPAPAQPLNHPSSAPLAEGDWERHVRETLAGSVNWPYWFGKGSPQTPWKQGKKGVDCSGYASMALVKLGLLSSRMPDLSSRGLRLMSKPLELGQQRPGDLAFYDGHVEVVISMPGTDGHSTVQGASGGNRSTHGDKPTAKVKTKHALKAVGEESPFLWYGRVVPEEPRVAVWRAAQPRQAVV